ncbi:MAG: hypothetical protein ACTHU0_19405 [Kofleriaceae bacterium]
MLQFPSDWVQQFGVNLATALPPELGARFRYHERLRPQPSFSTIVQRFLASDPEFKVHQLGEMVRVVTTEGEYGAWVAVEGRREGARAMRYLGAVFLDEFAAALDVIAILPKHFSQVEQLSIELLRSASFGMARRPRPFFYVPPVDWQAVPSGTTANWYPLDFPNNLSNIVVPAASRIEGDEGGARALEAAFAQLGAGLTVESSHRDDFASSTGVPGRYMRLTGHRAGRAEPIYRELAFFVVAPYAYGMRLETTNAAQLLALREVFRGVAGSFRPLPAPEESRIGRAFAAPSNLFDHWAS